MTDEIPRLDLASQRPTDGRIEALRAQFPDVFAEDKIDFDALKRSLGEWVDPGPERFGLTWPGKADCMRVIQQPPIDTLVPIPDQSIDWDETQNVIIEGENLEVLKLLQKAYYGKVKLIYIDPPYNTGKECSYPDNFKEGLADYLRYSGQVDEEGFKLSANAETDGRFHSKWLSMMYPRLFLARNLLRDDGVIFVSIDEHEMHHLMALLQEIFGPENFVGTIVWKNATDNNPTRIAIEHEYVVCFARNLGATDPEWKSADSAARDVLVQIGSELADKYADPGDLQAAYSEWFRENRRFLGPLDRYKYIDHDGVYIGSQSVHNPGKEGYRYDVIHPETGKPCKEPLMGYRFPEETMNGLLSEGRVLFGEDDSKIIELKVYASEFRQKLPSLIELDGRLGANELRSLFPEQGRAFTNPKPTALLRELIPFICSGDDLLMDFFAGSGSVGDAVMQLNDSIGSRLRYLLVQLPEKVDHSEGAEELLSRLCMERVRRATARVSEGDTGFRAYQLAPSNFTVWDADVNGTRGLVDQLVLSVDHVAAGRGQRSILTELLLKAGFPLTSAVDDVDFGGVKGYSVADGALLVCLSRELTIESFEAMVEFDPAMILVLDAGFGGNDELKVNALQTVRARNQERGSDIALRVV